MAQQSARAKKRSEDRFVKAIVEGKSQMQAYREAFPNAAESTVNSKSSPYAHRQHIAERIDAELAKIKAEDAGMVVNRVVQTAKQKGGDIDRNRELFFKLAGHPSFSKQTNISVNTGSVPADLVEKMGAMLDRLDAVSAKLDGGDGKQTDFIDAEYWPESGESSTGNAESSTTNHSSGNLSTENTPSLDDKQAQ